MIDRTACLHRGLDWREPPRQALDGLLVRAGTACECQVTGASRRGQGAAIALRMGRSIISRTSLTPTMHDRIEPNPGRKPPPHFRVSAAQFEEDDMTFGKGALLWLIGIPLPIILLLALFWR